MRTTHHEPEPGSLPPGGAHAALEPRGPTRRRRERGASLVEYALMVALVAVVCIGAVAYLGTSGSAQLDKGSSGLKGDDGSRCRPRQKSPSPSG